MEPVEKNMIIGAFITAGVKMGLEGWWAYNSGKGIVLTDFPYVSVGTPLLPSLDTWIADAGTPIFLYILGKGAKKESFVQMSKGGAIYGTAELSGITMYRVTSHLAGTGFALTYQLVNRRM
jgi:hypothetical protein